MKIFIKAFFDRGKSDSEVPMTNLLQIPFSIPLSPKSHSTWQLLKFLSSKISSPGCLSCHSRFPPLLLSFLGPEHLWFWFWFLLPSVALCLFLFRSNYFSSLCPNCPFYPFSWPTHQRPKDWATEITSFKCGEKNGCKFSYMDFFLSLPHGKSSQIDLQLVILGWVAPLLNS